MTELPDGFDRCAYPTISAPVRLQVMPEHQCPYFGDRLAQYRACRAERIPGSFYHGLMDANFRRSGTVLYQPICRGCRLCVQIRVPVARFAPRTSQRRCWRRNADLTVTVDRPSLTDEKYDLYRRYVAEWHGDRPGDVPTLGDLRNFLYESPVETVEFTYRDADHKLLAIGICDVCPESLSSVYFYFDPAESRRGLGTFGAMAEIKWADEHAVPFYYLGYWVKGCPTMDYKVSYRPAQLLYPDGVWRDAPDATGGCLGTVNVEYRNRCC